MHKENLEPVYTEIHKTESASNTSTPPTPTPN